MIRSFLLICVALISQATLGQTVPCPNVKSKVACDSFKELLTNRDRDLLEHSKSDVALVCFREKEDGFFTVTWMNPENHYWEVFCRRRTERWKEGCCTQWK